MRPIAELFYLRYTFDKFVTAGLTRLVCYRTLNGPGIAIGPVYARVSLHGCISRQQL